MDHTIQGRVGSSYSKVYTIEGVVFLALFYLLLLLTICFLKLEQE